MPRFNQIETFILALAALTVVTVLVLTRVLDPGALLTLIGGLLIPVGVSVKQRSDTGG